ncbi:MAG: hypothetical protein JO306_15425, partial [Gemmatimonadetes bacterium]|nr:hypothetical protein [Gemmatimonadota bacterium]
MSLDTSGFPTREEASARWEALAAEIAAARDTLSDHTGPRPAPENPGRLVVLGSGIQSIGFTLDAEDEIRRADEVFFCVADPATQLWIRGLRPDAHDLYV